MIAQISCLIRQIYTPQKIDSAKKDFLPFSRTPGTGLSRWNDCLKTIKQIHGNDEAVDVLWEDEFGIKSQIKFKLKER